MSKGGARLEDDSTILARGSRRLPLSNATPTVPQGASTSGLDAHTNLENIDEQLSCTEVLYDLRVRGEKTLRAKSNSSRAPPLCTLLSESVFIRYFSNKGLFVVFHYC